MRKHIALASRYSEVMEPGHLGDESACQLEWSKLENSVKEKIWLDLAFLEANGFGLLTYVDPGFPARLRELEYPPHFITYCGPLNYLGMDLPRLAVVGSREPSRTARDWLRSELNSFLRTMPTAVYSGGAYGIDQEAEILGSGTANPTCVFLPAGLAYPYPRKLKYIKSMSKILWMSTYSPFEEVKRYHFEYRNRLIAKISDVVLIPEAKRRSGSTMTGRLAAEAGVPVAVVPQHPSNPWGLGCLDLLMDGALPVRDRHDLQVLIESYAK